MSEHSLSSFLKVSTGCSCGPCEERMLVFKTQAARPEWTSNQLSAVEEKLEKAGSVCGEGAFWPDADLSRESGSSLQMRRE